MIVHYFKTAFRNMWKYRTQSLTGIFGLAFGLACFVPALYWMRYETSYDGFYPGAENIYRIYAVEKQSGKVNEMVQEPLVLLLREQFPATEASAGFYPETNACSADGAPYVRLRTLLTGNAFFSVFAQEFVSGDAREPLQAMYSIVLTETVAINLFGDVEKAVGQQIQSLYYYFYPPYTVTAVVKDPPDNTSLPFDAIISYRLVESADAVPWIWNHFSTQAYVKLHPGANAGDLAEQLRDYTSRLGVNSRIELRMMPVSDVHQQLASDIPFTLNFIGLFVAAGILLLFSAVFNFMNLHLDLFRQRSREFRQRAVHGAGGGQLTGQMMFELSCAILMALFFACCFVVVVSPAFSGLLNIAMEMPQLMLLFAVCGTGVMALMLLTGFMLFRRLGRLAMRPQPEGKAAGQPALRRMAVSLQLAVSVVFIIAAMVVMMQIRFVNHKDPGFNRGEIIQLSGLLTQIKKSVRTALIHELEAIPQVTDVTTTTFEPKHNASNEEIVTLLEWPGKQPDEKPAFHVIPTDSRFAGTFGLNMLMGKWPDESGANQIVLNEEAVRVMGLDEPVGTIIRMSVFMSDPDYIEEYKIVGVVNDFHTLSLRSRIQPTIFRQSDSQSEIVTDNILYIRTAPGHEQEAIGRINAILPGIDATMAGVHLTPVGELYDRLNQSEQTGLKMFSVLAAVCMLISLFGIYAVATASTRRRRKEIAIRKIAGAEAGDVVRMFFREHTLQVIIAGIVALPPVYIAMSRWLQGYAYRTDIPWWLPAGVIAGVAAVVLLTVLGQVLKAAGSNPAEVVKSE
ncbi:MAG: ABC transporter permease [Tannerellaceae bacterium]|jgi:putative ABC transport system permease protein|nr:ABC transporter permease [Tannerellaceae bacterium]